MKEELKNQLKEATTELDRLITAVSEEQFNEQPFEGSWTAGQVADHIIKSQKGITQVLYGAVQPTDRDPGKNIEYLRKIFLDFSTKMKAPDFIKPSTSPMDKNIMLERSKRAAAGMEKAVDELDLSLICSDFKFPGADPMTRLEWLNFLLFHTMRHNHQFANIVKALRKVEQQ